MLFMVYWTGTGIKREVLGIKREVDNFKKAQISYIFLKPAGIKREVNN